MTFDDFKLSPEVSMGLNDMGFKTPTPIQLQAIPVIKEGKDILASAQTGTGKTAAFALPILDKLSSAPGSGIRALILAPTRELAIQIDEQFWSLGYHSGITSATVYGGSDWGVQDKAIKEGVNVLVATPGRLLDHIKISKIDFSKLEFLVLDEADRMLDMGFIPDVKSIIHRLPKKRQTLMFSATLSGKVESLARELTYKPVRINISSFKPAEGVTQLAYLVEEEHKIDLVLELFDEKVQSAIIFTSTKRGADSLSRALYKKGLKVSSIHGDRDQKEREATLGDFKSGRINVLVATDVMSRGIDVTGVSHVVNFSVPRDLDDYIHRIGRTARAEKTGVAMTLVSRQDSRYFSVIKDEMGDRIQIIAGKNGVPAGTSERAGRNESPAANSPRPESRSPRGSSRNRNDRRRSDSRPSSGRNKDRSDDRKPERNESGNREKPTPAKSAQNEQPKADSGASDVLPQKNNRRRSSRSRSHNPGNRPQKANEQKQTPVENERARRISNVMKPVGKKDQSGKPADDNSQPIHQNGKTSDKNGFWNKISSIFKG